jgi:hypothetical protein
MAKKTSKSAKTSTKSTAKAQPKAQPKKAAAGNGKPVTKKAAPEKQAAAPDTAASPQPKTAAKATKAAPRARDSRLPAPGTVLQKKDRQGEVRCECTVEAEGIRYQGTLYRSLSAAAMAASKDMGLGGRAQNGYLFWNIIRQPAREKDPVAALERAWERYESRAKVIVAAGLSDETKAKVLSTVRKHVAALESLQGQVA